MNAAITVARLGVPCGFLGRVSTDEHGDAIWAHLQESGVDLSVTERGSEPTALAVVTTVPVQSFRFEGKNTADTMLSSSDLSPLGDGPHIIHGGTLGIFRGRTADRFAELVASHDGLVSFDPNARPQIIDDVAEWHRYAATWFKRADVIRGSDEDFDWIGMSIEDLLGFGPAIVIRTVGARGAEAYFQDGSVLAVSANPIEFVDAVGAGDSFCGAVLAQLWERGASNRDALDAVERNQWREIIEFAIRVSGATCSRSGANPPWASELA